jgi:hypothetical protein
MIICTKCGFQNEDSDTFCGSCAGFLEWSGQQVVEHEHQPEPEPEPEAPAEEEHAGFIDRVKDRIGIGESKDDVEATNGQIPAAAGAGPQTEPAGGPEPGVAAPHGAPQVAGPLLTAPAPEPITREEPVVTPPVAAPAAAAHETAPPASAVAPPAAAAAPPAAPPAPPAAPPAPPTTAAAPPSTVRVPAAQARTSQPGPAQPAPAQPGAAQPSVATAPVQPNAVKPVAVKARPTPRAKTAQPRVVNPGDLVCGQCGEGNDPARKFCRRCGASLVQAHVFTLPWYRRLWRRLTTRRTRVAGERPRLRRRMVGGTGPGWLTSWVTRIVVLVVIVAVILAFVGPWHKSIHSRANRYYHDALNVVHPTYNAVHPVSAKATSSAPGHPATFAIDGATNTSWQAGAPVTAKKPQVLTVGFAAKTNLDRIGFLNGDQDVSGAFLTEPRLHVVRLTTPGPHGYSKTLTLKDSASFQQFGIKAQNTAVLVVTIESVYPSSQGAHAAVAEVEFFKKS